jgi:hypothetical protein
VTSDALWGLGTAGAAHGKARVGSTLPAKTNLSLETSLPRKGSPHTEGRDRRHGVGKATTSNRLRQHRGSRYHVVDAGDGVAVSASGRGTSHASRSLSASSMLKARRRAGRERWAIWSSILAHPRFKAPTLQAAFGCLRQSSKESPIIHRIGGPSHFLRISLGKLNSFNPA